MAEFCRECFITHLNPSKDQIERIVMSQDDEIDLCEGCGEFKPFVMYIDDEVSEWSIEKHV